MNVKVIVNTQVTFLDFSKFTSSHCDQFLRKFSIKNSLRSLISWIKEKVRFLYICGPLQKRVKVRADTCEVQSHLFIDEDKATTFLKVKKVECE